MNLIRHFVDIYLWRMRDRSMRSGMDLDLVNSKQTCLTGPLEYKYHMIFVLVLGVTVKTRV